MHTLNLYDLTNQYRPTKFNFFKKGKDLERAQEDRLFSALLCLRPLLVRLEGLRVGGSTSKIESFVHMPGT